MERRLRSTVEGGGAARGSARTVDLETRAPWAEWAWRGGALAATLILAHVRGLPAGLVVVLALFAVHELAPAWYAVINPQDLEIGVPGVLVNLVVMITLSLTTAPMAKSHLRRFEL